MEIPSSGLEEVRALYERGLYLQALEASRRHGPLASWSGTAARLLAGRLAGNLGARRLALSLHLRAGRADAADAEALYYSAYALLERRGPLAAWETLRARGDLAGSAPQARSDVFCLRAEVAASLRDFDTAEHWLARADEAAPERTWTCVARARVLELEDRYPEALEAVRKALELRPWYRPAVQGAASLLVLLDRDREALELLREASTRLESGAVLAQKAALETELGLHEDARATLERYAELSPLLEKDGRRWLAARRSDAAYYCGDLAKAAEWARQAETPFYTRLAGRLEDAAAAGRRVLLPVGFVRQHHMTCAPATLSAISRFWSMPSDHFAVAERICYDGTPAHSERRWAQDNGWVPREFDVTMESASALLDLGVPFTLTTVEPASAHLQAVIGYDGRRGTFLVRDPYERHFGEFLDQELLQRYRSGGPRGMALVPAARRELLDGVALPAAELYDRLHAVVGALEKHDRSAAWVAYRELEGLAPGHRLTLHARRSIAAYDADRPVQLECYEALLKLHPEDANFQLARLALLRDLGRRDERLALLGTLAAGGEASAVFGQMLARELAADARRHPEAEALVRRALRMPSRDAESYHLLAGLRWDAGRREEALELYRFATCLEDKHEGYAESYFIASRHLRQTAAALLFLRNRFRRFGKKSSWPARTLFMAYEQLERTPEGFQVLEEARALRPEDGDLLLFLADARARTGDSAGAQQALRAAEGKAHRSSLLRAAAQEAGYRGAQAEALPLWRRILESEPLAMDARAAVTRLLAETEGRAAAFADLRESVSRFPHHEGLRQLRIEWLREGDPVEHEQAVRELLEIDPVDAWARRELALFLARSHRPGEALVEAETACRLEPSAPSSHYARARALAAGERTEEAKEAYRAALRISVDFEAAASELVRLCASPAERRAELAFLHQELVRQVIFGEGVLTYRQVARDTLEPAELLETLREAVAARPDLWHAWTALVRHLVEMDRLDEAAERGREATGRFPLVPPVWLALAQVFQLRGDAKGERETLEQAVKISPSWSVPSRELAGALERAGEFEKARAVLEKASGRSPLDPYNHGGLALMLRRLGDKEGALARLERAVKLEPGYEWAWSTLLEWAGELGRPELPERLARELAESRAGEARSWVTLARSLAGPDRLEERLRALRKAAALEPRDLEPRDLEATLLAEAGRFDEALEVCSREPSILELRGRAAWIEARRGDRAKAIGKMKELVAEDPSYAWGWAQLTEWHRAAGDDPAYLEAARMLVRLTPQSETALGFLGEAKLRSGDRKEAKALFLRSIEVEPAYGFGGLQLLDLLLEDGETEEAERVAGLLKVHIGGPYVAAREVRVELLKGRRDAAAAKLRELCLLPGDDRWPFEHAVGAMTKAGAGREAREALRASLSDPNTNPEAAWVWAEHALQSGPASAFRRELRALEGRIGFWAEAASAYLERLGERRDVWRLRWFVHRNRERLRERALSWGTAAFAMQSTDAHALCVRWMEGWERREGVKPWMLLNLVCSLRALGRDAEAVRAGRAAVAMPEEGTTARHRLWLAFDEALRGDARKAASEARRNDDPAHHAYYRFLAKLVCALEAASDFGAAAAELGEARKVFPAFRHDAVMRRAYRSAVRKIGGARGGWGGWLWAFWRMYLTV
jgi:tetratricopeptide (TPR) repeat protein